MLNTSVTQESGLPSPASTVARKYDVERSCIRCHERKVRCNRATPCSTCMQAGLECRYPPGNFGTRRRAKVVKRDQTVTQIREDSIFLRLEPTLSTIHRPSTTEPRSNRASTVVTSPNVPGQPSYSVQSEGVLLSEGHSSRYVDEPLFSRVLAEKRDIRSTSTPLWSATADSNLGLYQKISFDGLFSNPSLSSDVTAFLPSRRQAIRLWQTYLNNIDVLLKILHIPTTQSVVYAAISTTESHETTPATYALLFAIYFAATTSLGDQDTVSLLGKDRKSALQGYQRGLEISLHSASFLDAPVIMTLQAMTIYLLSLRSHNSGRSVWTLNGLLVRSAQCIGLHRDGRWFQLSPLACEIRRRLWHQIVGFDSRVAEDHGLSSSGFSGFSDTKLPLNVDDRDLDSDVQRLSPEPKAHFTEMTLFLITMELNESIREVTRLSVTSLNANDKMTCLGRLLQSTKARIHDLYLQYCDPYVPIQKAALLLGKVAIGKLEVFVSQQYLRGLSSQELAANTTEQALTVACDTIELGDQLKSDELLANFHWLFSSFVPYHLLTYALVHLCVRPGDNGATRAFQVVEHSLSLIAESHRGPKWYVLQQLREKALGAQRAFIGSTEVGDSTQSHEGNRVWGEYDAFMSFKDPMMFDFIDSLDFWSTELTQ